MKKLGCNSFAQATFCAIVILMCEDLPSQTIPTFSGADGAGAIATGGRGGVVYHVTRLDGNEINQNVISGVNRSSVPGTLAYGLSDNNFTNPDGSITPRTIVFDVGGTFWLGRRNENVGWDSQDPLSVGSTGKESSITIAGQTAPGGVYIMGGGLKLNGNNIVLRNVTVATGYGARGIGADGIPDAYVYDAINLQGQRQMVDHVSTFFATDETISANESAHRITVQYSNISQAQNYPQLDAEGGGYTGHALGSLIQPGNQAELSFNYNLYAHQKGRLPRVGSPTPSGWNTTANGPFIGAYNEFRGNVFYNWLGTAGTGASGQQSNNNFIGNYYLAGPGGQNPNNSSVPTIGTSSGGTGIFNGANATATRVFRSGNVRDINKNGVAEFTSSADTSYSNSTLVANRYNLPFLGQTLSAQQSYAHVLNYVGANWWNRSGIDARIINEVKTGTGQIIAWADPNHGTEWNSLLGLRPGTYSGGVGGVGQYARPASFDTDRDGMPDSWEVLYGLNPNQADNNGDYDLDGYTNLEEYLNELAEWPSPVALAFTGATNNRYAQITNWSTTWQPSRFDTAVIHTGNVVMDAVGQHAGILQVGAQLAGQSATLEVSNGWIQVADRIELGTANAASGSIIQTGGQVRIGNSLVLGDAAGSTGIYSLENGELYVPSMSIGSGNGVFNLTGGKLHAGIVNFDLTNNGGIIAPGNSIGHMEVVGNLTLNSGSLEIEVYEMLADTIGVSGQIILGGSLEMVAYNGYVPQNGDFWTILQADGGIIGAFNSVTTGYSANIVGNSLIVSYFSAVPEPAFLALVGFGCCLLLWRRNRNMPKA